MKKTAERDLTAADVRARLDDARGELAQAREDLPKAQRAAARAYLMRQPYDDAVSARFNIARLEDIITGLQLLLPVAEHRDRCVEITELEREKSALQPRIDTLDRRYRELIAQTRDLPDPMASFLGSPAPHPKVVEKNRVGAELRSLESSRDGIDFSIAAAKQRCADLERAHPDAITEGCDGSKRAAA